MPLRSYIEDMDQPTVLCILYSMVSAQQMNLLPGNTSQTDAIFPRSTYRRYGTTSQCLSSYGCTITMVYTYSIVLLVRNRQTFLHTMTEYFQNNFICLSLYHICDLHKLMLNFISPMVVNQCII